MRIKKFFIITICLFLSMCVLLATYDYSNVSNYVIANAEPFKTIIIDAGHGGFDGGAVAVDGTVEKNINLNIALAVGNMLSLNGIKVVYTRTEDKGTEDNDAESIRNRKRSDLNNRLGIMKENPEAVFVSIHLNEFTTSTVKGAQVFYSANFEDAKVLGNSIQESIKKQIQKENHRVIKMATSDTFLLYNATVPAVIVECGFLSNESELELLKTKEYQAKMAFSVFCGICDFLVKG